MQEIVFIQNNEVLTDSLTIAEMFGKRHKNVTRDIENIISRLEDEKFIEEAKEMDIDITSLRFEPGSYIEESNKQEFKKFFLNFDAFMLVTMGYTTKRAMLVKMKYITEFNQMKNKLTEIARPSYTIEDPAARARRWAEEYEEKKLIETEKLMLEQQIADYEPKISYLDTILKSTGALLVSQIADDYGMSARELNKFLHETGIQYKRNGQWLLYSQYKGQGYTKSHTTPFTHKNGEPGAALSTKWTQKGRIFIHQLLEKQGYKALMDRELKEAN